MTTLETPSQTPETPTGPVKISVQRWVWELFVKTAFLFDTTHDEALGVCAQVYRKSGTERLLPCYWQERVYPIIDISIETSRRLGVLGVWGLRYDFMEGKSQIHSKAHRMGAILTGTIWKLPEKLIEMGYSLSEGRQVQPRMMELNVPNGIYLEMYRESETRQVRFQALAHEAILNVHRLLPLEFGPHSQRMKFRLQPECLEKLQSFASIHQITEKQALILILGQYFFVGEETGSFLRSESGHQSELWL